MKNIIPSYCKNFNCTASKCSDNCCIGWEIDIDEKSKTFYDRVKGDFGQSLKNGIENNPVPHFKLKKNERCTFLNDNNLCEIIINLGKDHLCDICRNHPRFFEWFCDTTYSGIGLCCEEGARLLFENDEKITFHQTITNEENNNNLDYEENVYLELTQAKELIIEIMQNKSFTIKEKLTILLAFGYDIENYINESYSDFETIISQYSNNHFLKSVLTEKDEFLKDKNIALQSITEILDLFISLEHFDESYTSYLTDIKEQLENSSSLENEFDKAYPNANNYEYEKLMVYFIYRYFLKSVFDYNIITWVKFFIISYIVIRETDLYEFSKNKTFNLESRIAIVKRYSKEIEYSDENLDAIADESYGGESFSYENMINIIFKEN